MALKGGRKMNPINAHLYLTYLELYEFGTPLDLRLYDIRVSDSDWPLRIRRMAYQCKSKAKYCEDRLSDLKLLYSLRYIDGYRVQPNKMDKFCQFEKLDPLGSVLARENLRLFSSAKSHGEADNIVIGKENVI